jgi:DNA-directed RNA polymerase specialized sigma24 family protein
VGVVWFPYSADGNEAHDAADLSPALHEEDDVKHTDERPSRTGVTWWASLDALDHRLPERWLSWARSTDGVATINGWAAGHPPLRGWSSNDLVNPTSSQATDAMQAVLVELAQAGSAEAGLTLLVQLRPGLIRLARTAVHWEWMMSHDINEETQATFFEVLFRHRLDRRPKRIAANLLLDTRQRLWRRHPRSGPPTVVTQAMGDGELWWSGDRPSGVGRNAPSPVQELEIRLHLADVLRRLPGSEASRRLTAMMAYRAWIEGHSTASIASELGVEPQTVSTRLYRLRRILRSSW